MALDRSMAMAPSSTVPRRADKEIITGLLLRAVECNGAFARLIQKSLGVKPLRLFLSRHNINQRWD